MLSFPVSFGYLEKKDEHLFLMKILLIDQSVNHQQKQNCG